jgi:hypothetical protein
MARPKTTPHVNGNVDDEQWVTDAVSYWMPPGASGGTDVPKHF